MKTLLTLKCLTRTKNITLIIFPQVKTTPPQPFALISLKTFCRRTIHPFCHKLLSEDSINLLKMMFRSQLVELRIAKSDLKKVHFPACNAELIIQITNGSLRMEMAKKNNLLMALGYGYSNLRCFQMRIFSKLAMPYFVLSIRNIDSSYECSNNKYKYIC